jgi:hypothetical protein
VNCPDDQLICNESQTCISGQFQCLSTKQCIPMGWVCDGEPDCGLAENLVPDTSDEDSRRCHRGNPCQRNYFRCKDGITCRKLSLLCDGNYDCPDYSDELDFCGLTSYSFSYSLFFKCFSLVFTTIFQSFYFKPINKFFKDLSIP